MDCSHFAAELALMRMEIPCLAGGQTCGPEKQLLGGTPLWQCLCVAVQCCVMVWGDRKEHQRGCIEVEMRNKEKGHDEGKNERMF